MGAEQRIVSSFRSPFLRYIALTMVSITNFNQQKSNMHDARPVKYMLYRLLFR